MPIALNGSTSGKVTVQAAATAANNTLTLPSGNGMLVGQSTTTAPTNGQIPIGNGTDYTPATITAGTGITVTNGAGSISIANTTAPVTSVNTFTGAVQSVIVSGTAVASTSGTSIDFTSIPSWVKRITVMCNGVSTNGTSNLQIQIGSGSITNTGYISNGFGSTSTNLQGTVSSTTGFLLMSANAAAATWYGIVSIGLLNASTNIWASSGSIGRGDSAVAMVSSGGVTLSGTLDRVRITTVNGTDTFDAGSINILYE